MVKEEPLHAVRLNYAGILEERSLLAALAAADSWAEAEVAIALWLGSSWPAREASLRAARVEALRRWAAVGAAPCIRTLPH